MKRYIALLRGINVGGKNKIAMAELKIGFSELGMLEVATHLNSGNVIFSSPDDDAHALSNDIQFMIKDKFDLDIPVHIVSQAALQELLEHAPDWWGNDNKAIYDNLIFLMSPLSYEAFYHEMGSPKAELEQVEHYKKAVFWSFSRKDYQKTNWWSKTANSNVRNKMTIRTANTIRKIAGM
ncbi:DUF1697 domain-containing protein [Isobaculum melis]|uniref:Uncharacterized conserved protein, DUF1697 family n=1 Tax=Isobaculum melis TaxID=142588 RepID=A0A1H9PSA7_9LACT|nr:DUF1697 domain-containing protein [Isobaculum melis]SER50669.1 Uncharacterized conserved protein, DUF1697 family [Isobaculum melis]